MKQTGIWSAEQARQYHVHSPGLAQWLCQNLDPHQQVYDFGCGMGYYLQKLAQHNFKKVCGFEGTPGIESMALSPHVMQMDITTMHIMRKRHIVRGQVICLEVMEHIHRSHEENVLKTLQNFCEHTLILSWAIPGQNGLGHINCKPAAYVHAKINALGFKIDAQATAQARQAASAQPTQFFNDTLYVLRK